MTRDAIRAAITEALGPGAVDYFIDTNDPGRQDVVLKSRELTFDRMAAVAVALNTRDINIDIDEGFRGSDVTPADDLTVKLYINGIP